MRQPTYKNNSRYTLAAPQIKWGTKRDERRKENKEIEENGKERNGMEWVEKQTMERKLLTFLERRKYSRRLCKGRRYSQENI
jgi:hypothetical protein